MDYTSMAAQAVLEKMGTTAKGLSPAEAERRLSMHGANEIRHYDKHKLLKMAARQFNNPLVMILIAATAVSLFIGNKADSAIIIAIVVLNSALGFTQEYKTDRAIEALRKMATPYALAMRGGKQVRIETRLIVPGDIILLSEGSLVPADARIVQADDFYVDESMLTGESNAVHKNSGAIANAGLASERLNMCFMGSLVTRGSARAVVVATGMGTEMGGIADLVQETKKDDTPLQKKLALLSRNLSIIVVFISIVLFVLGMMRGIETSEMFLISVSMAVAAIPSALPAIVTLALALGTQRMVKKNALVKKLPIVETLGSATVICSDKTGTITENRMSVDKVFADGKLEAVGPSLGLRHKQVLKVGALCNNSFETEEGMVGDPTENALLEASIKAGVRIDGYTRIKEISFSSERKMMTVVYGRAGALKAYMKGAPEVVMERCTHLRTGKNVERLTLQRRREITRELHALNSGALRVLGMAVKEKINAGFSEKDEHGFVFVGMAAMRDPPREGAIDAIARCKDAGIKVIMITGDHELTAKAIAEEVGLLHGRRVVNGRMLELMTDTQLRDEVGDIGVFARVSPQHKLRIVQALQENGEIVGMTGDGVNDAPAMKKSDIGIAMGLRGTDVAKESSDMIMQDDNFSTIVEAVREGRAMYDNIKKSVRFLVSCNAGEVMAMFMSMMSGLPIILLPAQILLMNLLTDGIPALALGVEKPESNVMRRKPNPKGESPIGRDSLIEIMFVGLLVGIITMLAFYWELPFGEGRARSIAFSTIVFCQMAVALNFRSSQPLLRMKVFSNKWLWIGILSSITLQIMIVQLPIMQALFHTVALGILDWLRVIMMGGVVFASVEAWKLLRG